MWTRKHAAPTTIPKLTASPSNFSAAAFITLVSNATKQPDAAKPKYGQKKNSMKKLFSVVHAATNWKYRNIWTVHRHVRLAKHILIRDAACTSICILNE